MEDNIILFASSVDQFVTVAQDVTDAIYSLGFRWKYESLECMLCGSLSTYDSAPEVTITIDAEVLVPLSV